jgi:hypothetical protein
VVAYFVLPFEGGRAARTFVALTLGIVLLGVVVAIQAWRITRDDYPRLRAAETLATTLPLFIVMFAATYAVIDSATDGAFTEPLSRLDSLYFTVTVFSTVGFGDIAPRSDPARVVTMVQMFGGLVYVGLVVKVLLAAVQVGVRRRSTASSAPSADDEVAS